MRLRVIAVALILMCAMCALTCSGEVLPQPQHASCHPHSQAPSQSCIHKASRVVDASAHAPELIAVGSTADEELLTILEVPAMLIERQKSPPGPPRLILRI